MIEKTVSIEYQFQWLFNSIDSYPVSKVQLDVKNLTYDVNAFIIDIMQIFNEQWQEIVVGGPGFHTPWDWFCMISDTEERAEAVSSGYVYNVEFYDMLIQHDIEPTYSGYCKVFDWPRFIRIIISLLRDVNGSESLFFYSVKYNYCFYLHNTFGIGIWYKDLNLAISNIIQRAIIKGFSIEKNMQLL